MVNKHQLVTLFTILVSTVNLSFSAVAASGPSHSHEAMLFVGTQSEAAKAVNAFHKALRGQDKQSARALLAENVVIVEGSRVERSANEYASHHMLSDMKYLAALEMTLIEHQVVVENNMAFSISRTKMTGSYKGKGIDKVSTESMALINTESGWKITHIHWSN